MNQQLSARASEDEPFEKWLVAATKKATAGKGPPAPPGLLARFPLDQHGDKTLADASGKFTGQLAGGPGLAKGKFGRGLQLNGTSHVVIDGLGDFDRQDAFSAACWVKPRGVANGAPLAKMNDGNAYRGWDLLLSNGQLAMHIIHAWPNNAIKVTSKAKLAPDKWTHLLATYDGSGKAAGVKLYFNGQPQDWRLDADTLKGTTRSQTPLKIGRRHNSAGFSGVIDDVRLYSRALTAGEGAALAGSDPIGPILAIAENDRSDSQMATLRAHYFGTIDKPSLRWLASRKKLEASLAKLEKQKTTSMIMEEQAKPRPTYLLVRGHYASPDKSKVIAPNVPAALPPLPANAPRNRLGLARWLVAPEHPLTARVAVNRYWTMLFGRGIVATPMDFGSQGAHPTHPQLLAWLAVDFRESGWDIKRAIKQMLMSATYRQSSRLTAELVERDPQNLLLARGPRFRLQGEMIRDAALSVSGLLADQIGGPGVKPYQPPGLWNEVSLSGNVRFVADKGTKLYRKSMYIYWKRSAPHPGMQIFDAPTREKCVVQRPRTNTPLQALYTLNGVQFVEAARALAWRLLQMKDASDEQRVDAAHRMLTARPATPAGRAAVLELLQEQRRRFRQNADAAQKLLAVGDSPANGSDRVEQAAWTVVCNLLLNMDATLTRF